MDHESSTEEDRSIRLNVLDLQKQDEACCSSNTTNLEMQSSIEKGESGNSNYDYSPETEEPLAAPEKKLTLFALRLAILEKAATGLGTLGFIWATVVLLGGFAITLDKTDFWFITIILLIEGTRIFSRSHELEWQHQATWSVTDAGFSSLRALRSSSHFLIDYLKSILSPISRVTTLKPRIRERRETNVGIVPRSRTWKSSNVPIFPYAKWFSLSRNVSKLLYWLQLLSATACIVLSLMKLIRHNYGEIEKGDMDKRNRKSALNIFYSLAFAEALLFLTEKAYSEWKISYRNLLEKVSEECELGPSGVLSIKRFFYDAYSKCVNGSIFDGLKMDMVSFAMELLNSSSSDEQLIGARILRQFSTSTRLSDDTLQKIGINLFVIERLVEILNWKDPREEEIRRSAGEILSKLAGKKQNSLRVAGISGAMESISSLLACSRTPCNAADEIGEKKIIHETPHYDFWRFNILGLLILKKLARDHDNCGKIGNTKGLLPKIIDFAHADEHLLKDKNATPSQISTVKRSLQLVKMLASTTGATGKHLRREISEIVFTICNIRDILRHGERYPLLQKLGIEVLTFLALEEDATERIGGTGGVLKELFNIFFKEETPQNLNHVRIAAGEALAMLASESGGNCHRILKLRVLGRLLEALKAPLVCVNAARILRNLCAYAGPDCFHHLKEVKAAAPTVLKAIILEDNKLQEVMVGLAVHVFKFMTSQESNIMFKQTGIDQRELAKALIYILKKYEKPAIKVPRIRRFTIELAIWMMEDSNKNIHIFKALEMKKELECVLETTGELENFDIFSGTVGLSRHRVTIHSLVEEALKLLEND